MSPTDATGRWKLRRELMRPLGRVAAVLCLMAIVATAGAWEHEHSKVAFTEYREGIVKQLVAQGRPFFLLFSAEWCHWCHEFAENTLTDDDVADYLNTHYTNVFIDADIQTAAYMKYRATGLPYTVFLNPDSSVQFRYAGTLYAEDFLTVIKQINMNVEQGLSVEQGDATDYHYEPPATLDPAELATAGDVFRRGVLENFDPAEHGLGKGEKAIYPRTFLYLLEGGRTQGIAPLRRTLERAIERIYDPLEGGFFRYAETRRWEVPHYEKMADINAAAVLLLFRLNDASPSPALVEAADNTLNYLRTTLYEPGTGVFLSFQQADTRYYAIGSLEERRRAEQPPVIKKIFIDRLADTVGYLIDALDYRPDAGLRQQIVRSLEFIAERIEAHGALSRYYSVNTAQWSQDGSLQDYVLVARLFLKAARHLRAPRYRQIARRTVDEAVNRFYDRDIGVLVDPSLGGVNDAELLMEVNGLLAESLLALEDGDEHEPLVERIITYFSAMGEIFDERIWDGDGWAFTERYVPYLRAVDRYFARRQRAADANP